MKSILAISLYLVTGIIAYRCGAINGYSDGWLDATEKPDGSRSTRGQAGPNGPWIAYGLAIGLGLFTAWWPLGFIIERIGCG